MSEMKNGVNEMLFADIHNHILFGVDDVARSESDMYQIIDAS